MKDRDYWHTLIRRDSCRLVASQSKFQHAAISTAKYDASVIVTHDRNYSNRTDHTFFCQKIWWGIVINLCDQSVHCSWATLQWSAAVIVSNFCTDAHMLLTDHVTNDGCSWSNCQQHRNAQFQYSATGAGSTATNQGECSPQFYGFIFLSTKVQCGQRLRVTGRSAHDQPPWPLVFIVIKEI